MGHKEKTPKDDDLHPHIVHHTLAHSYFSHFLLLIAGLVLDFIIPIRIFNDGELIPYGFGMIVIATGIIVWAQTSSQKLDPQNITKESFFKGPYCYTRTPTHWGLFLLVLGFGFVMNAFFVVMFTVLSFLVSKLIFVRREEMFLEKRYGQPYLDYKKTVKF